MPSRNYPVQGPANQQGQQQGAVVQTADNSQLVATLDQFVSTLQQLLDKINQSGLLATPNQTPRPLEDPDTQNAVRVFNDILAGLQLKFVPDAPKLEAKAVSSTGIELKWTDDTNNADGFRLWRCEGPQCHDFKVIAQLPSNARSYADNNLSSGLTYRYKLGAFNSRGEAVSAIVEARTVSSNA
jgi:hypothetical protein